MKWRVVGLGEVMLIKCIVLVELRNGEDRAAFEDKFRHLMGDEELPTEWSTAEGFPESRLMDLYTEEVVI